jgi:formylglycine-generating enzyme required for sulfatase activity
MSRFRHVLPGVVAVAAMACAGTPRPPELGMEASRVRSDGSRPLVVEWPSSDRAELEALARRGPVSVRYDATGMRLLPRCIIAGRYAYSALTPKRDRITIRSADELRLQVPLGAAKLEGVLERTGELNVEMTVVGRFEANAISADGARGDCSEATHVINALTVGAFDFLAGAASKNELGAGAYGAGAAGRTGTMRELLNHDGEEAACRKATASDQAPPYGCGAVMRVDLAPFPLTAQVSSGYAPPSGAHAPPSGTHATPTPSAPAHPDMIRIPPGVARIGAADLPGHALPVQDITMQAFEIDLTEVTIRAYASCVDDGPCTPPAAGEGSMPNGNNGCGHAREWFAGANKPPTSESPVTCVTPPQAAQYCSYVHKRLPTEEEWEYAARGTDFRRYPWGNADPSPSRVSGCGGPSGCPVGKTAGDRSAFGVLDMGASMREITVSRSGYEARGGFSGAHGVSPVMARAAYRDDVDTLDGPAQVTSFRCASSSAPPSPRARVQ